MSKFECTNELMKKVTNQTEIFIVCLNCQYNLECPILNEDTDNSEE